MTRKGQRIKIVDLTIELLPTIECGSYRIGIEWLKEHGFKPYSENVISDYFRLHPDRCTYVPDNRQYAVIKLKD